MNCFLCVISINMQFSIFFCVFLPKFVLFIFFPESTLHEFIENKKGFADLMQKRVRQKIYLLNEIVFIKK